MKSLDDIQKLILEFKRFHKIKNSFGFGNILNLFEFSHMAIRNNHGSFMINPKGFIISVSERLYQINGFSALNESGKQYISVKDVFGNDSWISTDDIIEN